MKVLEVACRVTCAVTGLGDHMAVTYALADMLAPRPPEPTVIRTLWRMQGPTRIVCAELRRHPAGRELVVLFEGVADDLLETRFERLDFAVLERRSDALKELLTEKGWVEVSTNSKPIG